MKKIIILRAAISQFFKALKDEDPDAKSKAIMAIVQCIKG